MKYLKLIFLLTGIVLFGIILHETNLEEVGIQISKIGLWGMLTILILYAFAYLADVFIWLLTLPNIQRNLNWVKRLYLIRMAGTAFNYVTPLASMGGEPIKAMLLKDHYGIPYRDTGISFVLAKTADVMGLLIFLFFGLVVLSFSPLINDTYKIVAGIGFMALLIAFTGFFLVQRFKITSTSANWLSKTRLGRKLAYLLETIHDLEDQLIDFYTNQRSCFISTLFLAMTSWLMGSLEIYLVMQFLGHPISLNDALVIESFAQLVRNGTFFIPASIGAQEGAFYLICNAITGIPALGVAVAMLRRFREIVWISLGLLIWWLYSLRTEMKTV